MHRNLRINLLRPGADAAFEVVEIGEPVVLLQPLDDVAAPAAAATVDDDLLFLFYPTDTRRYFGHGDQFAAEVAFFKFVRLTDVDELEVGVGIFQGLEFLDGDFFHGNR